MSVINTVKTHKHVICVAERYVDMDMHDPRKGWRFDSSHPALPRQGKKIKDLRFNGACPVDSVWLTSLLDTVRHCGGDEAAILGAQFTSVVDSLGSVNTAD